MVAKRWRSRGKSAKFKKAFSDHLNIVSKFRLRLAVLRPFSWAPECLIGR